MKITTEKQKQIKLYDWLKAKTLSLKDLIQKKNFNSYSELISYCDKLGMLPCSQNDFDNSYKELFPPKIETQKQQINEEFESDYSNNEVSLTQENAEVVIQKQSKKKLSQPG